MLSIRVLSLVCDSNLDLANADLTGANLRLINFIDANLSDADLTDADVEGAVFGDNAGLTELVKQELQRRGAVFQDSPESDVPALVRA